MTKEDSLGSSKAFRKRMMTRLESSIAETSTQRTVKMLYLLRGLFVDHFVASINIDHCRYIKQPQSSANWVEMNLLAFSRSP
jgi:hypothetical protein